MQHIYNIHVIHIQHTYNTYAAHELRERSKKRRGLKMKSWPAMRKLFSGVENKKI